MIDLITKGKTRLKILIPFLFVFLLSSIVYALPPFQSAQSLSSSLEIRIPPLQVLKQGTSVSAHTHVFNATNGLAIDPLDADCLVHIYNSSGSHIFEGIFVADSNGIDFEISISGTNFSRIGLYSAIIQCNSSSTGGFTSFGFEVTDDGMLFPEEINNNNSLNFGFSIIFWIIFIVALAFIVFMHIFQDDEASSVVYGFFSMVFFIILAAIILIGFNPISLALTLPFNPNTFLAILFIILGFYAAWYSTTLLRVIRAKRRSFLEKESFK